MMDTQNNAKKAEPLTTQEWRNYLREQINAWPEWKKRSGPCYYAPVPDAEPVQK